MLGEFTTSDALRGFEGVVISALPNGRSLAAIEKLRGVAPKARIIDLSGDLRLQDKALHEKHYPSTDFATALRQEAIYGCPELNKDKIASATLVSNPGCLATATLLALAPIREMQLDTIFVHTATGSSGAGKEPKPSTHHPIRHANMFAYRPFEHQHEPEVQQALNIPQPLNFVPHSLPVCRGILASAFVRAEGLSVDSVMMKFNDFAKNAPFVRFCGTGGVELENVVGSNFCDISVAGEGDAIVIHAAIDNLIKGMAGQAIQNLNIMCGWSETAGLWSGGWRPI